MISTLKKLLAPLKNVVETSETLKWYLISLASESAKHSLEYASRISGIHASQFSRLLTGSVDKSELILSELSKKAAKTITKTESNLESIFAKLPWSVYLIIDSTPQRRSASKAQNVSRFNLGGGYWFGHRWTNAVLFINGHLIPLVPIPYRSKKECKKLGIEHKTENELICEYLDQLNLDDFMPGVKPEDVAVLLDAGYDAKKVQNKILSKGWDIVGAIGRDRNILVHHENPTHYGKENSEIGIANALIRFNRRAKKVTCKLPKLNGKTKRKIFTVKRIHGSLKGVEKREMAIISSHTNRQKKVKFIACSRAGLSTWKIVQGFALRFYIEQFHKEIKQYFGFEDLASHRFDSVISYVNFVYSAHILLNFLYPNRKLGMKEKQRLFTESLKHQEASKIIQISTRFGAKDQIRKYFKEKFCSLAV